MPLKLAVLKICLAAFIGLAASADDLAHRRISNWIPVTAFLGGLCIQAGEHGWRGGVSGFVGSGVGAGVFLVFYLLGGMGGGDVKLMAGFGAVLGPAGILEASLWTAGCGGLLAISTIVARTLRVAWSKRALAEAQRPLEGALNELRNSSEGPPAASPFCERSSRAAAKPSGGEPAAAPAQRMHSMPYAPAIALGVWLSLIANV